MSEIKRKKDISDIPGLWIKKDGKIIKNPLGKLVEIKHLPPLDFDIFDDTKDFYPYTNWSQAAYSAIYDLIFNNINLNEEINERIQTKKDQN